VTGYQVVVTNLDEQRSLRIDAPANATSVTALLDGRTIGFGFAFTWRVDALSNGQVLCSSRTISLQREAEVSVPTASFSVTITCGTPATYTTIFNWSGLGTDSVTFTFLEGSAPVSFGPFTGNTGSQPKSTLAQPVTNIVATTSGGAVINIAGPYTCL
jgi:hypothetical protein